MHKDRRARAKSALDKRFALVPGGGVEPPRAEARRILSPLRLPVPPSRLANSLCSSFAIDLLLLDRAPKVGPHILPSGSDSIA